MKTFYNLKKQILSVLIVVFVLLSINEKLYSGTISGTFTTLTNCPQTLSAMCLDPVNGVFYAVGDQGSNAFYKYTISTGVWTALANAPVTTGNNAGATYLGGKIYVAYTSKTDIQVYTVSTNTWTTLTGPTDGVYTGNISNDGSNVFVACQGTPGKFWRYNVGGGTWTELASTPVADRWGGLAYNNGYFYSTEGNGKNHFQKYRVATDTWTTLTDVPLTGAVLGAAIYDAYYYCMGDYTETNLYSYDLGAEEWNNTLTLPWTINDATICVYGSSLYIIQGEAGTGFTKFTPNNPMLTSIEGTALSYNFGDAAVNVTSTLVASQNAGTNFQSATISITSGFQTGKDILSFVNANGISGSWNSTTGVLTLSGTTTIANYQTALRSVQYYNNDLTSNNTPRVVSFQVYDGSMYSNTANRTILIPGPPAVTTATVTNIGPTGATCGGTVTEDNGATVTARGVCWNTTGDPTISDPLTTNGSGMGTFTSSITGLTIGVTYYVRAYATNSNGTSYGTERSFIPELLACIPPASTAACTYMWITNVSTTGGAVNFSNATVCAPTSYTDYHTTKSASQAAGSSVTMSFTSFGYDLCYAVWIDFDDDAVFESTEKVISYSNSSGSLTVSTSFTVPVDAPSGSHFMRVRGEYGSVPTDPCNALAYGETEDYSFTVGSSVPSDPTSVSASSTTICSATSTTLTANGIDGTVYWYTGSCGGTATSPATGNTLTVSPTVTTTYYARNYNNSQYSAGCVSVTITVRPEFNSGTISSTGETICYNGNPASIGSTTAASGGDNSITYKWQANGTDIPSSDASTYDPPANLTTTTTYTRYAKDGTCNSFTLSGGSWVVTVRPEFTSGTISSTGETICYNGNPAIIGSTTAASGGDNSITYKWQANGTDIPSSDASTYDAPANLTTTTTYTRYAKDGTCNSFTLSGGSWVVTVRPEFTSGTISSTGETICYNGNPAIIGSTTAASGGDNSITYKWQANGTDIPSSDASTYDAPANLTTTTTYTRYAKDGTCNSFTLSGGSWVVTVRPEFTSGTISSTGEIICYNGNPAIIGSTTAASGGDNSITYKWQANGTDIPGSDASTYDPPANLTTTTTYTRYAKDGTCNSFTLSGGSWVVTVRPEFNSGTISSTGETICYNGNPASIGSTTAASGGDNSITYKWQANGTDIPSSDASTYDAPANLTTTTTYTRYAKDGTCNSFTLSSGSWVVTVRPEFTSGTISSTGETICYNGNPASIGSTTAASGGDNSITYKWQANGTDIPGSDASTYDAPANLTTTTTYTRYAKDGTCNSFTLSGGSWVVTVRPEFTSGTISSTGETICYNGNPTIIGSTTAASGGDNSITYKWQANGTDIPGSDASTYDAPANLTTTTTYTRYAKDGTCNSFTLSSGSWVVTVRPEFTSGTISSTGETICYNGNPTIIGSTTAASGGDNSITYKWQANGTDIPGSDASTYDAPANLTTTTTYTRYAKDGTCNSFTLSGGSWVVTVRPEFNSGTISSTGETICYNGNPASIGSTTAASGGDNSITYKWQANGTDIPGSDASTYDAPANLTTTTTYTRYAKDGTCNSFTLSGGSWVVTVRPEFTSGTISSTGETICYNGNPASIGSTTAAIIDNGSIINSFGTGYGANNVSIIRTGGSLFGFGNQQIANNSVMDDFTLLTSKTINSIEFQGYQTGSTTTSTFTGLYFRIYDGEPGAGGNVIWGDFTTNRMTSTTFSNTYRVESASTISNSARPVMSIVCEGLTIPLNAGTYWLEWQATGTLASGPWQPPTSSLTGNARQYTSTGYAALADAGSGIELPFTIRFDGSIDASGGDNSITYKWQANGTDIPSSDAATYDPPAGLTATTTYTRYAKDGTCNNFTLSGGSWIVTIDPPSVGGTISGTATITYGSSTGTMTLGSYIGTIQKWQKKLGTGSWIDISNTNATYSETPTGAGTWYYKAFVKSGTCSETTSAEFAVTVEKKALSITANNIVKIYDGLVYNPFTVSYNGFVLGEDYTNLTGNISYSGTAVSATEVGTYIITPEGFTSTNYIISYFNGSLTINCSPNVNVFNNNNSGYGSLRNAMANLCSNGTITFNSINNQTINLTSGTLAVDKNITFNNSNHTNGITIAGSGTNLTINTGKVLTLASNSKITVSGAIVNNAGTAGFVIESGASFIHNTANLQATAKRYLNNGWHLIGSPFKKTLYTISNIAPAGGIQIKPYTNGTNWQLNVSSMYTYLLPTTGYAVKPSANYTMTLAGNLYYSSLSFDNTVALTYNGTSATQSWNLLANPYTSNIDFKTLTKTNISQSLYIWDNTRYPNIAPVTNTTYFNTFNTLTNVGVPVGTTSIIAPMQGFFVKAVYTTPKIVFTPAARTHSNTIFYKSNDTEILLRLKAESEQGADELAICKNESAKQSFEEYDSEKLLNANPLEMYSYAKTGEKLTINTANANKEIIPLGINAEAGSKVKISSFGMETAENLYLEDRLKGKIISLSENTEYSFIADEKSEYGRFFIRFGNTNSGLTSSDISVTQSGNNLSIIAQTGESIEQIEIYTITGARVYSAMESTNVHTVNLNLSKAIYLIRVKTSVETQNLKFNWK